MNTLTAYAREIEITRLAGSYQVTDGNTGAVLGQVDLIKGFAYYHGAHGSAHQGVTAFVRDGLDGLREALAAGLRSGRDDRR